MNKARQRFRSRHARVLMNGASGAAAPADDLTKAMEVINGLNKAFDEFKKKNDERLTALSKGQEDVVRTEELDRINTELSARQSELDELNRRIAASQLGTPEGVNNQDREHTQQILNYMRTGAEPTMTATVGSDPDGGYTVSEEMEAGVDRIVQDFGALGSMARRVTIGSAEYMRLRGLGGAASGWVGEEDARPETATPTLQKLRFPTHEIYANPFASQTLLDDSTFDIAAWLAEEVGITFAEQEAQAFITGDGDNKPRGIISGYTPVENSTFADTTTAFGYFVTGVSGGFGDGGSPSSGQGDEILDLIYGLNRAYRQNGMFIMNDLTQKEVRKFKDADGNYIWQPSLQAGQPAQLFGYGVEVDDFMPDIAADSFSIAFGDWQRAYLIVDRTGVRILRDPYTNKPYVGFYTTKRVGGGIQNFEAAKLLKFGTS